MGVRGPGADIKMGISDRTRAGQEAFSTSEALSRAAYNLAVPAIRRQGGILNTALDQGEPGYLRDAFASSRAILTDSAASGERADLTSARMGARQAAGGGNFAAQQMDPSNYGARIAQALYSSRVNESQANIEQMDKTLGFMTGQAQETGSGSLAAMSNQLGAIPYMRAYDPTYANVIAALNAGASVYGAGNQAGWFNSKPSIPFSGNTFASTAAAMPIAG